MCLNGISRMGSAVRRMDSSGRETCGGWNDAHIPIRYIGADSGVMVLADQEQVAQVFVNIIRNALQALEKSSRLKMSLPAKGSSMRM